MLADDHEYFSGLASVALAVLMLALMLWIRSHMADAAPVSGAVNELHTDSAADLVSGHTITQALPGRTDALASDSNGRRDATGDFSIISVR
jgi:hypothetical protein